MLNKLKRLLSWLSRRRWERSFLYVRLDHINKSHFRSGDPDI